MLSGDALDDALEQHGVVGGLQRRGVQQIDLELPDAIFRDCGIGGHVLLLAGRIDFAEEVAEILDLVERKDGIGIEPLAV